jgi:CRP/FNR family transcriptional regulator
MVVGNRGRVEGMAEGGSIGDWTTRFAGLSRLAPEIKAKLVAESRVARVPEGTVIFGPGRAPENLLLLLEGAVRVHQTSEGGREIFLYRVHAGESCVLTTACLLAYEDYSAEGVAETELKAVLVPRVTFDELIARSPEFRRFVFTAYSRRITDLFLVIEEIAFRRVDVRLAQKLLQLAGPDGTLHATHQSLAVELGSVREVISRQLQEFQRRGWVELGRGVVRIVAPAGLSRLAEERS